MIQRQIMTTAFVAISSLLMLLTTGTASAQEKIPNLVGAWKGEVTGGAMFGQLDHQKPTKEPEFQDRTMQWTLTVNKQDGRGLIGTWASPSKSERLIGAISIDNETVYFVDEDTHFIGRLQSENRMELCARETGKDSMVAACLIIDKQ